MAITSHTVDVGGKRVGPGEPCFVVAEPGNNHDGDVSIALALIDAAAESGADAVKFQLFQTELLYPQAAGFFHRERMGSDVYSSLKKLELPPASWSVLVERSMRSGLVFFASVFDEATADMAEELTAAYKIASLEITHLPLLRHCSRKKKPMLLSTGASTMDEVREAVGEIRGAGCDDLILLQCTSAYPAPMESLHLNVLRTLYENFGVPIGLSDHSLDPVIAPVAAIAKGACVIEKHITLDKKRQGPDHEFALEPDEFSTMVAAIRSAELVGGATEKSVDPLEADTRAFARRTLFAVRDLEPGDIFSEHNVALLRAGHFSIELHPRILERILGTRCMSRVESGTPIPAGALEIVDIDRDGAR